MSTSTVANTPSLIRIASRESALALWQSNHIKAQLESMFPGLQVEIHGMTTKGDQILDVPLAKIGGKGLFVKELEQSMLNDETDIAVHSMKDVPMHFPEGLELGAICKRESPYDAFVSNNFSSLDALPEGAIIGTSSLRRQCQIQAYRPDLVVKSLRGNVNTRLAKLDNGEYEAIILAASGLVRLGFQDRIKTELSAEHSLPAVGQGALGIECRSGDSAMKDIVKALGDIDTDICVRAERAMNERLEGGCQVPIAGFAELNGKHLSMRGLVASVDGKTVLNAQSSIDIEEGSPEALGIEIAENLLAQGAQDILSAIYDAN